MFSKSQGGKTPNQNAKPGRETAPQSRRPHVPAGRGAAAAPSILGRNLIITGDIKTDGDIQIDGRLDGNLHAGSVTIGESGAVNGKLVVSHLNVRGKVTGKIDAHAVELAETANVQADIVQDSLIIANGAFFDGKCSRKSAPTVSNIPQNLAPASQKAPPRQDAPGRATRPVR